MKVSLRCVYVVCALLVLVQHVSALSVPQLISDNMVFQQNAPIVVWGVSQPNDHVSVVLHSYTGGCQQQVQADAQGNFRTNIQNCYEGAQTDITLTIKDSTDQLVFEDVAIGDVYLCAGQSNMEMTVDMANNATAEENDADNNHYPLLRLFAISRKTSLTPLYNVSSRNPAGNWLAASPQSVGQKSKQWSYFSATCYFFGREIYRSFPKWQAIPIGLVASDWGGTYVEAWSSPDALAKCNTKIEAPPAEHTALFKQTNANDPDPSTPSVLWNGMITPLLPMRLAGAVWYQGEANAGNPTNYACRFPAMIADWRAKFNLTLPFYYVELAAYDQGYGQYPAIRQAQTAALALPNTGRATAVDLGTPQVMNPPFGSIHPMNKQDVGRRLALLALANIYKRDVVSSGPIFTAVSGSSKDGIITVKLQFDSSAASSGLHLNDTQNCYACCAGQLSLEFGFNNGKWIRAAKASVLDAQTVQFAVEDPRDYSVLNNVRYMWDDYSQCAIYNKYNLPANPFTVAVKLQQHGDIYMAYMR